MSFQNESELPLFADVPFCTDGAQKDSTIFLPEECVQSSHEEDVSDCSTARLRELLGNCVNCQHSSNSEALVISDELIRREEMNDLDRVHRAYAFRKLGRWADSMDELNSALEMNPNRAVTWEIRAYVHYRGFSDPREGIVDATRAIELDPTLSRAYRHRADCLMEKDEHESAILDATKAIGLDPNTGLNYASRGSAYYLLYKYDLALADFNRSIQLNPQAAPFGYRARLYFIMARYESALSDLDRRIDELGSQLPALENHYYLRALCLCLVRQDYPAALRDLVKSFEMDPEWGELEIRIRQITPELVLRICTSFIPNLFRSTSTTEERRVVESFEAHIQSVPAKYLSRTCANQGCSRTHHTPDAEATEMKICHKCHEVCYCSKQCQCAHWPVHKQVCHAHRRSHKQVCQPVIVRRTIPKNRRRGKRNRGGGKKPPARVLRRLRRETRQRK